MRSFLVIVSVLAIFACGCKEQPASAPISLPQAEGKIVVTQTSVLQRKILEGIVIGNICWIWELEITLDDMPSVVVFVSQRIMGPAWWRPLPIYSEEDPGIIREAYFVGGGILLLNCDGYEYKIVIVK